ncbi:MAG: Methane oxygenase PmoA [uncultured Adhaeribacter sp.]|uniref:Methane oxygenase PmoA n=1 Tax=uncultured Adhaeribacter sp. TaxID=448109 RepID=A0A6J4IZP0_9BACT|nr:MAG: Methane oxygenase PmoA [uncultured Adhaeribacter sp.]
MKKRKYTFQLPALLLICLLISGGFIFKSWHPVKSKAIKYTLVANEAGKRVDVLVDGKPFTSYIYPDELMKPVLYPLRTAKGTLVTRGWPFDPRRGERVDHPHHVGMWFNYGDVNGLDFWNNSTAIEAEKKSAFGTIKHRQVTKMTNGNDKAELDVVMDWQKPDGSNLVRENTKFIFSGQGNDRYIDRITTLTALKEEVLFKDNKEGVLGIRLARELEHPSNKPEIFTDASGKATPVAQLNNEGVTGKYRSSAGKEGDDVWGTRGKWVNLTGTIQQEPVSLVMLDNPQNIGFPTYWHARGYGLFAANPLGQKAMSNGKEELNFKLAPGKAVTFRHRIIIHSGSGLTDDQVNAEYQKFAGKNGKM